MTSLSSSLGTRVCLAIVFRLGLLLPYTPARRLLVLAGYASMGPRLLVASMALGVIRGILGGFLWSQAALAYTLSSLLALRSRIVLGSDLIASY